MSKGSPRSGRQTCFACGAAVSIEVPANIISRYPCQSCHQRTKLAAGGARLSDVLRSTREYPLEGNGLNVVLNPVVIDGHRGWASFYAGSFMVLEEVHDSASYFEFVIQHCEPGPTILSAIRAAELDSDASMARAMEVVFSIPASHGPQDVLSWLCAAWVPPQVQSTVAAHQPILTNEQAWVAAEARMAAHGEWTETDQRSFFSELVKLANKTPSGRTDSPKP